MAGAAVSAVTGCRPDPWRLLQAFRSKDDLLVESLRVRFGATADTRARAAEHGEPGEAWKAIVKTYLRPEMCNPPVRGCSLPALRPNWCRADAEMKPQVVVELVKVQRQHAA